MSEGRYEVGSLQELVLSRLHALGDESGPLSLQRAADKARGKLSPEVLRRIARGEHGGRLRDDTAEGLSLALDVPVAEIYRVAGLPRPGKRWEMPEKYDRLTMEERRAVEGVAAAILAAHDRGVRHAQQSL